MGLIWLEPLEKFTEINVISAKLTPGGALKAYKTF